jgi:hypothetical protein
MRRLISVFVPLLVVLGAGPSAFAAWSSTGSGEGAVAATSVNAGSMPATSRNDGTVALSWAASTLASGDAVGYYDVIRSNGETTTPVCVGVALTNCDDIDPLPGPVSYAVVPRIGAHWKGAPSPGAAFTYDDVAPVTSVTTRTPTANEAGWNTGDVSVTLTAVDPGPVASGVREIHYSLGGAVPTTVNGSTATFLVSQEAITDITFYAVDVVGNVEGEDSTEAIKIDRSAPVSSGSLNGNTLTLSATDSGGSGVAKIEYKLGSAGTTYSVYGSPLTLTSGQTIYFRAVDVAGNVEAPDHQVTYTAAPTDTTAPVTTVSNSSPPPNATGWNRTDVTLTMTSTDAGSVTKLEWRTSPGSAYTVITGPGPYTLPTFSTEGITTVEFRATDAAGNIEPTKTYAVKIDKTAPGVPTITDPVEGRIYRSNSGAGDSSNWGKNCGTNNGPNICGTAADGTSGVASASYVLKIASGAGAGTCWTGSSNTYTSLACGSPLVADGTTSWSKVIAYAAIAGRSLNLTVTVTDAAGNTSAAATRAFSAQ